MTSSPYADVDSETHTRIRQQEVVAELGQQALETDDLDQLMHDAAAAVATTLDNEYAKVLELLPGGDEVLLRHGVGWRDGLVGNATVPTDLDSQAGYTLRSDQPIIVDDLRTEERFSGPDLLVNHNVISGISVIIGSVEDPWGVLGTHTTERREFTEHDANFVQSVANVLAGAIGEEQTKQRLLDRERELEETFDRITDGFIGLDENWQITYINDRGAEILDPENQGLVGENFWDPFEPALGTTFEEEYQKAMETQEPTSFEEYYPPLEVWFEVHAYPSQSGLSIYFRDATERKERERKLKESERRYRSLAENFPNGIVTLFDDTLEYTLAAGQAFDELPVSPDDVEGGTPTDVWGEEVAADLESLFRRTLDGEGGESVEVEYAERTWLIRSVPVTDEDDNVLAGMTMAQDITQRKEVRRKLEKSERLYRTLAENFPNGAVGVYDHDLRYTLAEGSVVGETLPSADAVEGKTIHEIFPEETADELEPLFRAAIEEDESRTITTRFNDRFWQIWTTPLHDPDGETYAGLSFAQDITERVNRQQQLEESNERLEQFAYAASHDLQEPLRMVSSYLQLLDDRYSDELDEDAEEFLEYAVDGADRMREMINGLLAYSRVETQGDPLEPVDLNTVLDDVLEDLQLSVEDSDAEITADELPRVQGDSSQLRQVFQNLLSNAITYSGDEPPRIHVEGDRRGRKWLISVHDEGVGIDPEQRERVFEVFHRLHSREEHAGTGIGLALTRRIIERHTGQIWVESEPGEGATFSFTLPAADESTLPEPASSNRE